MASLTYLGDPFPLGATWDGSGVNFALFSEGAERVELCLFEEASGETEVERIALTEQTDFVWHVYLPEARPGQLYGYRVYGPYDPQRGLRFNPHKLLLDPYAKALTGPVDWSGAMFGYPLNNDGDRDTQFNTLDSAEGMPKCVVIDTGFTWGDDRPPKTPFNNMIIYEAHVKGFTCLNAELPEKIRGTYAGIADHRTIAYLRDLGVTAIELLPVHQFVHDKHVIDRGLTNYWGYNTIGFFAPHWAYSSSGTVGQQVAEFKTMVKSLHSAGIEVILDVVYNHTGEGNHYGPTLSFRGIDNQAYYRLAPGNPRFYNDYTGTGNTLNTVHPRTMQLMMDSLRYWVQEMHVDGFRFDLASTLARELHAVDRLGTFFDIIHQDPVLSQVKLIAEPWDVGEGGYQVGNFPVRWAEWNDKYRDTVRRFWRGDPGVVGELGFRLTGSSDLYAHNGRRPYASINFVTAHDGFTMRDLVSYNQKHNAANGEESRDGTDNNLSWNCGEEGPTKNREIKALRARQIRNLLTTLLTSQGVPMILHGDETLRTQGGNNNAYCQDNEITWQSWDLTADQRAMLEWTKRLIAFRRAHPVLRRRHFFQGRRVHGEEIKDISWLRPDGHEMSAEEWHSAETGSLAVWLSGTAPDIQNDLGQQIIDDDLLLLLNQDDHAVDFTLPDALPNAEDDRWLVAMDTNDPQKPDGEPCAGGAYRLAPRAMAVLRQRRPRDSE